jgi:hypothetical protein
MDIAGFYPSARRSGLERRGWRKSFQLPDKVKQHALWKGGDYQTNVLELLKKIINHVTFWVLFHHKFWKEITVEKQPKINVISLQYKGVSKQKLRDRYEDMQLKPCTLHPKHKTQ